MGKLLQEEGKKATNQFRNLSTRRGTQRQVWALLGWDLSCKLAESSQPLFRLMEQTHIPHPRGMCCAHCFQTQTSMDDHHLTMRGSTPKKQRTPVSDLKDQIWPDQYRFLSSCWWNCLVFTGAEAKTAHIYTPGQTFPVAALYICVPPACRTQELLLPFAAGEKAARKLGQPWSDSSAEGEFGNCM